MYVNYPTSNHQLYPEVTKSDFAKIMDIWNQRCPNLPPRSFIIWYDLDKNEPLRAFGLDSLGLSNLQIRSLDDLLNMSHPDHKVILDILVREAKSMGSRSAINVQNRMLRSELRNIWRPGIHLSVAGSVKKNAHEYWSAHVIVEPVAPRSNTSFSSVFLWFQITGVYTGAPLTATFFPGKPERYQELVARLNQTINKLRYSILDGFDLTKNQKALIQLMVDEPNPAVLAEKLGISLRTLEGHRSSIVQKGNFWFKTASFRTAQDVVDYLQLRPQ